MNLFPAAIAFLLAFSAAVLADESAAQSVFVVPTHEQGTTQPADAPRLLNSVSSLIVAAASGGEISDAVEAGLKTMGSMCGTVTIAPGSYTWSKAGVKMLPCETLQGVGATVLVTFEGSQPFLIVEGPAPPGVHYNNTYTPGSLRGVTFVGPSAPISQSSSTGIELGGTSAAEPAQLFNLYDVHVTGFGCGIDIAFAHQIAFFGGSIEGNYDGLCFAPIITGLENLNLHGTQILNNVNYGINEDQTGVYVELSLTDCSLDYNGQLRDTGGEVKITNGKLTITGSHLENTGLPLITIAAPGAPASVDIFIAGTAFNVVDQDPSRAYRSFISVKGVGDVLEIGRGVSFTSQGAGVLAVADWDPTFNGSSRLMMDPYTYTLVTARRGLPAYVGTTPSNYSYATYDLNDNVTGMAASFSHQPVIAGANRFRPRVQASENDKERAKAEADPLRE